MADKEEKKQETEVKKKSPLKLIIILVVVLAVVGGGGFFAYLKFLAPKPKPTKTQVINQEEEEEPETEGDEVPKMGQMFNLEPFIVNLAGKKEAHYLKVKMSLELKGKKILDEINMRLPQVRDIIIEILSNKSFEELATLHGKEHLKNEITIRLNSILKTGSVKHVYFTEFVMQ